MIARLDALNSKVDDILRFARPRTPSLESIDVKAVALEAIPSAQAAAGADCAPVIGPATSAMVHADREMLRAVLLNLILNACQSGSSEPIEVRVIENPTECWIEVLDRGAGFGDVDAEQLFQAFHTTKKSGTGLGLAIVRRLVALQGGSVTLRAREGGGAVARVTLPLSPHRAR
jgi:signal transduction histidine kinase